MGFEVAQKVLALLALLALLSVKKMDLRSSDGRGQGAAQNDACLFFDFVSLVTC